MMLGRWSPTAFLYRLVPPEHVVYASDDPYGRQPNALLMAVRTARASGLDDDQVRALLHDTAARIADGHDPVPPGRPCGPAELSHPVTFLRIHQYLTMASAMLWMRHPSDSFGVLGLALNACDERTNGHRAQTDQIRGIFAELHTQNAAYHDQLRGGFHSVAEVLLANPNDLTAAQALIDQQASAERAMKANMLAATSKALNVLTAEQRTELAQIVKERGERRTERRGNRR